MVSQTIFSLETFSLLLYYKQLIRFVNNTRPGKKHEVLATQSITDQSVKPRLWSLPNMKKEKRPDSAFNPEWKIEQPWPSYDLTKGLMTCTTCIEFSKQTRSHGTESNTQASFHHRLYQLQDKYCDRPWPFQGTYKCIYHRKLKSKIVRVKIGSVEIQ